MPIPSRNIDTPLPTHHLGQAFQSEVESLQLLVDIHERILQPDWIIPDAGVTLLCLGHVNPATSASKNLLNNCITDIDRRVADDAKLGQPVLERLCDASRMPRRVDRSGLDASATCTMELSELSPQPCLGQC